MRKIVKWKVFYDFEKEETYLNQMSQKGYALSDYFWCRYVFEKTPPNTYFYRLELLDKKNRESYLAFLEETGVECVAIYMGWAYLRKKVEAGAWDIYTNIDSKIAHCRRIGRRWLILSMVEFAISIYELVLVFFSHFYLKVQSSKTTLLIFCSLLLMGMGIFLFRYGYFSFKKMKCLIREKDIYEG